MTDNAPADPRDFTSESLYGEGLSLRFARFVYRFRWLLSAAASRSCKGSKNHASGSKRP